MIAAVPSVRAEYIGNRGERAVVRIISELGPRDRTVDLAAHPSVMSSSAARFALVTLVALTLIQSSRSRPLSNNPRKKVLFSSND